jgi:hypothetical protein
VVVAAWPTTSVAEAAEGEAADDFAPLSVLLPPHAVAARATPTATAASVIEVRCMRGLLS